MSFSRACSGPRIAIGVLLTIAVVAYINIAGPAGPDLSMAQSDSASGLEVTLSQASTSSPPSLTATVKNTNSHPVTILTYDSPLDPLVLQLGYVSVTPDGRDAPLDIAKVQVRRLWPPRRDQLVVIEAGAEATNIFELKPMAVPPGDLGKKAKVSLDGEWSAVWGKSRDEVGDGELDDPKGSGAAGGSFKSNVLEISVD